MKRVLYFVIALPLLVVGWVALLKGVFYLGQALLYTSLTVDPFWSLFLSFGATSISTIVASTTNFLLSPNVRRIHRYSVISAAVLFMGYLAIGMLYYFIRLEL